MEAKKKKPYQKPTLTTFGTIADLTKGGQQLPAQDFKGGSGGDDDDGSGQGQ